MILINIRQKPLGSTFSIGSFTPFFRPKPKFYNGLPGPLRPGHICLSVRQSAAENAPSLLGLEYTASFGFSFAVLSASNAYP